MAPKQQATQPDGKEKRCIHCGSSHTSSYWRHHPTSGQRLCSACGEYARQHGGQLPPNSVLQRRAAEPRQLGTREEMAQRRCLQCGSASPGEGKRPTWHRHPATGEEWLCGPCYFRIRWQLSGQDRRKQRHLQAAVCCSPISDTNEEAECNEVQDREPAVRQQRWRKPERQAMHSLLGNSPAGGEQALPAHAQLPHDRQQRQRRQEKRWQRQQEQKQQQPPTSPAFHGGPASAAKKRARSGGQPTASTSDGRVPGQPGLQPDQHQQPAASAGEGTAGYAHVPAAKRRRKQGQPRRVVQPELQAQSEQEQQQHSLPVWHGQQPEGELSLAPTALVEGAEEAAGSDGPAAASLHGSLAAGTGLAAAVAVATAAAASEATAEPAHQEAAPPPQLGGQLLLPLSAPEAEPHLFDLLQQAVEVAAAAASGLTPELAAAFVMLPPLEARREAYLRRLLQRSQYSAAAMQMRMAVHLAGFALPSPG